MTVFRGWGVALLLLPALMVAAAQPQSEREKLRRAMADQPDGQWPRGSGHVVLAWPGTRLEQKGYHEPGGSFSPSPGSFGIQIQIHDASGQVQATSDSLPLDKITQRWTTVEAATPPGIETRSEAYRLTWWPSGPQQFSAKIDPRVKPGEKLVAVIGSAGPAGGPIRTLTRKANVLRVNDRWDIVAPAGSSNIQMFGEPEDGWAQAWIVGPDKGAWTLTITDSAPLPAPALAPRPKGLVLDLPDKKFVESLEAQIAHLRMGLVGAEVRPGDPVNYPLAWLRDGAYTVVALAQAGDVETAKALARMFAERDFFGGFGPEADGPGLSLWAVEETAVRARDPQFDAVMWPHAWRKAQYILRMASTTVPLREVVYGPIVPSHMKDANLDLVCLAAKDGLINGRMDWHRPLLFVNGVSYRGLLSASAMAARTGFPEERWKTAAEDMRVAWWKGFDTTERGNERTAIVGLWPSWVAGDQPARYRTVLEEQWTKNRAPDGGFLKRPLWTYFDIAQAHEWLYLGDTARVWKTLNWFWSNQSSPGLYSFWEGEGEENGFGLWEQVRGWVKPTCVTPHYWTAAELLSLQVDMLAYVDDKGTLIAGAGVPKEWTRKPMKVSGILTRLGSVAWTWDGRQLAVTLDGKSVKAQPGAAFR
jgi:hypothetical protein